MTARYGMLARSSNANAAGIHQNPGRRRVGGVIVLDHGDEGRLGVGRADLAVSCRDG
jgi:hypothetical protein